MELLAVEKKYPFKGRLNRIKKHFLAVDNRKIISEYFKFGIINGQIVDERQKDERVENQDEPV